MPPLSVIKCKPATLMKRLPETVQTRIKDMQSVGIRCQINPIKNPGLVKLEFGSEKNVKEITEIFHNLYQVMDDLKILELGLNANDPSQNYLKLTVAERDRRLKFYDFFLNPTGVLTKETKPIDLLYFEIQNMDIVIFNRLVTVLSNFNISYLF